MMNYSKVTRTTATLLIFVSLILLPRVTDAQVEKRLAFTKARTTFTLRGKLPKNSADYDAYVFRARKGQTIKVKLTTADQNASFAIYELKELGPDEDQIVPPNEVNRQYTGAVPITSEYAVQVYGKAFAQTDGLGSGAAYTIEISLK